MELGRIIEGRVKEGCEFWCGYEDVLGVSLG